MYPLGNIRSWPAAATQTQSEALKCLVKSERARRPQQDEDMTADDSLLALLGGYPRPGKGEFVITFGGSTA
jgi:hypothetical protein